MIPSSVRAGSTIDFTIDSESYSAPEWALRFDLVAPGKLITWQSTADGSSHRVLIPAASTAAYTAAGYTYAAYFVSGSGAGLRRYDYTQGRIQVLPDYSAASTGYDGRTETRKIVEALRAALASDVTTLIYSSKSLGDMSLSTRADIETALMFWEGKLREEELLEKVGTSGGRFPGRAMYVDFTRRSY
jgi:hypothetical protein